MSILQRIRTGVIHAIRYSPAIALSDLTWFLGWKYNRIKFGETKAYVRPNTSDIATFIQVFCRKEYDLGHRQQFLRVRTAYQKILDNGRRPIIVDAGANVGAAAMWFALQFPEALIFAIEPDADNAEICRLNTQSLQNVSVIEAAIGSVPGLVQLSNPLEQAWTVQTTRSSDGDVSICTVAQLVAGAQEGGEIFLVKIDIEGFEEDLFACNTEWIDQAAVIMIEPHDWMFPGKGTSRNFQRAIAARNFELLVSGENIIYVRLPE